MPLITHGLCCVALPLIVHHSWPLLHRSSGGDRIKLPELLDVDEASGINDNKHNLLLTPGTVHIRKCANLQFAVHASFGITLLFSASLLSWYTFAWMTGAKNEAPSKDLQ